MAVQFGETSAGVAETLQSRTELVTTLAPDEATSLETRVEVCCWPINPDVVSGFAVIGGGPTTSE